MGILTTLAKGALSIGAAIGTTSLVNSIVDAAVPVPTTKIGKITSKLGRFALTGMLADLASTHIEKRFDEIVDSFNVVAKVVNTTKKVKDGELIPVTEFTAEDGTKWVRADTIVDSPEDPDVKDDADNKE